MPISQNKIIDKRLKQKTLGFLLGALLILTIGFWMVDQSHTRRHHLSEAEVLMQTLSASIRLALAENDHKSVENLLGSLNEIKQVRSAVLYSADGKPLADFQSTVEPGPTPVAPGEPGTHFRGNQIEVVYPLPKAGGTSQGTIFLRLSPDGDTGLWEFLAVFVVMSLVLYFWGHKIIYSFVSRLALDSISKKREKESGAVNLHITEKKVVGKLKEKTEKESQPTPDPAEEPRDFAHLQTEVRLKYEIQVRKQAEEILKTHHRILEQLAKGHSLKEVLDLVSINLEQMIGPDTFSTIYTIEEENNALILKSAPSLNDQIKKGFEKWEVSEEDGAFGASAFNNEIVISENISEDPRWADFPENSAIKRFKACWAVPIPNPAGASIGVAGIVCTHSRSPSVEEIKNLNSSAFLAGMAITRKRYEEDLENYSRELARSNQDLTEFASIASHDLQEPLRKVTAFGERLKKSHADELDQRGQDYLERMLRGTVRMQRFITDLLDYSRAGARSGSIAPVDLNELIKDVLIDFEIRIEEIGAVVQVGDLPEMEADIVQIRQVFANLIGNALKFVREGETPRVDISARYRNKEQVEIIVEDNGIGFDNNMSSRIFKPFERLNPSGAFNGSGMGLALCRKIVERHQGTVSASSEPGKGTRITLEFPLHQKII